MINIETIGLDEGKYADWVVDWWVKTINETLKSSCEEIKKLPEDEKMQFVLKEKLTEDETIKFKKSLREQILTQISNNYFSNDCLIKHEDVKTAWDAAVESVEPYRYPDWYPFGFKMMSIRPGQYIRIYSGAPTKESYVYYNDVDLTVNNVNKPFQR